MKLDVRSDGRLDLVGAETKQAEVDGFDALWVAEAGNDPFVSLAPASLATTGIEVGTAIAVAFARTPMLTAQSAWDLQRASGGRFLLGLGTQVRAHIERRYSMPWSAPVRRMREYVGALRAIWHSWEHGEQLDVRGEFYTHTLMPPVFRGVEHEFGAPKVFLAAVGPKMAEVAGECADGVRLHAFTTDQYVNEVTLPSIEAGLARSGRSRDDFQISYSVMYATGRDDAEVQASIEATRARLAFYGSTPAYRSVLEAHGWGSLHERLHELSRRGEWAAMGALLDDEVLNTLAVVGSFDDVAAGIVARCRGVADRVGLHQPYGAPEGADLVLPVATSVRDLIRERRDATVSAS